MLTSSLLSTSGELRNVASGDGSLGEETCEDTIRRLQGALLVLGFELPDSGPDGTLNPETAAAIRAFKSDRGLSPADESIDAETVARIDYELSFQEGTITPEMLGDLPLIKRDPLIGAIMDRFAGRQGLEKKILDSLELGEKLCFRLSFVISPDAAAGFSKFIAEPAIFKDWKSKGQMGPSTDDFFDTSFSFKDYQAFLQKHNPKNVANLYIGKLTRPDILTHRPNAPEWYEIKPLSPSGIRDATEKFAILGLGYPALGYPYVAGTKYVPKPEIEIYNFFSATGPEKLDVFLDVVRPAPGLIFWSFCIKGDVVQFFNRVRMIAGVLALLAAIAAEAAAAAAEAGALVVAIRALAAALGVSIEILKNKKKPPGA